MESEQLDHPSDRTIADWFYRRLSLEVEHDVERHLAQCSQCLTKVHRFREEQVKAARATVIYA